MQNFSIRRCLDQDLNPLGEIYVRSFADPSMQEDWTTAAATALLADWYRKQPELFFVAESNSRLLGGFVVGLRPWWDGNHLVDGELFVEPGHQPSGVGSALIKRVLEEAKVRYAPVLWETYTFRSDSFPLTWYKQLGFKEIEEWVMIRGRIADLRI